MNSHRLVRLVTCCVGIAACSSDPLPKGPAKTLKTYPHAADRYARLLRRQLTDTNPVEVEQALTCEQARMGGVLGGDEAVLRILSVQDSVLQSPGARAAHTRVARIVAGKSYQVGGSLCDSLNAIADREDPIVKVDSARSDPPPSR